MPRIYISAAHKSSGKTTLSIGLCAALHQKGFTVQPFKKGPDYIDPLWLSRASERACHNLDFNTMSDDEILHTLSRYGQGADISIIEGNKGLYDGVALDGSDSNAAVAKLTQSPVILVIDTRGITRGVAPLLKGYQDFDRNVNVAGVIYNLSGGGRHEEKLRAVTEEYTDIPVLGVVKKNALLEIDERHLGLMPSNESKEAEKKITDIANIVADSVDLEALLAIAKKAPILETQFPVTPEIKINGNNEVKLRIGICEDPAFGFYYEGDKQALRDAGAELISINTLEDEKLPENLDGLFIGG
ncbi:MAG: cobyrinate a,c-diamide synthase, partial [Cocleimonas sp.]